MSNQHQFTQSKWGVFFAESKTGITAVLTEVVKVGESESHTSPLFTNRPRVEIVANARLATAAPEMLALIIKIKSDISYIYELEETVNRQIRIKEIVKNIDSMIDRATKI